MKIATNRAIPVTYGDKAKATLDLGGRVVISEPDLVYLIRALDELQKLKGK